MEEKFAECWERCRQEAVALGARIRPQGENAVESAHRILSSSRRSEGFGFLAQIGRLDLSLEALAVDRRFTALFCDTEANHALTALLDAGYSFPADK